VSDEENELSKQSHLRFKAVQQQVKQESHLLMDQSEVNRMAKQRYLIKEIAQKGYSKELFSSFLASHKPDHIQAEHCLNIDLWTFEELDKVVLEF
jgi:hypothetical protein